jgi:hypothetical protein
MSHRSRPKRRMITALAAAAALTGILLAVPAPAGALGAWSTPTLVYSPTSVQTTGYAYAADLVPGSTDRAWTCHSRSSGTIRDDIFETKLSGGTLLSSTSVLAGTGTGWDSFHNCDPSVVAVDATIGGTAYHYAMFYTGNDQDCSCHNQVGVAFATTVDGPWTKYPTPVIAFDSAYPTSQWGVGQPSATSIDPAAGTVVLTWTSGYTANPADSRGNFAQVSFATGAPVVTSRHQIQTTGLTDLTGASDFLNNFDIVYSPQRDVFYLIREAHPYPTSAPDYISTAVQVASITGSALWSGSGSWTVLGTISSTQTGLPRNHNPGFARTVYGTLPDEASVRALVTTSSLDPNSLWTYRVWSTTATL